MIFAIAKAKTIINNNSNLIFILCYKFDVDARFDKETARDDELLNIFESLG